MKGKREQRDQQLNPSSNPQHTLQTTLTAHEPPTDNSTSKQQNHSCSSSIPLDVMQGKQLSITHQVAVGTSQHIDWQLVIAQQATSGNLHARLEAQRREQADNEDVVDDASLVIVIRVARAIVGHEICADKGSRDNDEKSLDEENCAEPETVTSDAFGRDQICAAEGEKGAQEERS